MKDKRQNAFTTFYIGPWFSEDPRRRQRRSLALPPKLFSHHLHLGACLGFHECAVGVNAPHGQVGPFPPLRSTSCAAIQNARPKGNCEFALALAHWCLKGYKTAPLICHNETKPLPHPHAFILFNPTSFTTAPSVRVRISANVIID